MDPELAKIRRFLKTAPPLCLEKFQVSSTETPDDGVFDFKTAWRLSCGCGATAGAVLGHPLRRLLARYHGLDFVGPLAFECSRCKRVTEIIDTDVHGYHAQSGHSSIIRGEGARERFRCPECWGAQFSILVECFYCDAVFDLAMDEPDLALEDYFTSFGLHATCTRCRSETMPATFPKM